MSDKKEISGKKRAVAVVSVIILAAVFIGMFIIYPMITDKIIEISIDNMDELAEHDEQSLETNIKAKWDILDGIANHIKQSKCSTTNELTLNLSASRQFLSCIRLTLMGDGKIVSSNMTVSNAADSEIIFPMPDKERFIYSVESSSAAAEGTRELLVMGVQIQPFTVEGITYTQIAAVMNIDVLQNEMTTVCYEGQGTCKVVDAGGRYIVNNDRNLSAKKADNFFDYLKSGTLRGGMTGELLREKIKNGDTFSMLFKDENGIEQVMCLVPMNEANWYFIMSVPKNYFRERSISLIKIFLVMILLALLAASASVFIILQRRARLLEMEQKHRKELSDALVLAEQANRAKTTFLNNMSHDIRTPMNAIIGFTALASTHINNTERVKDYLSKINQSSSHLLSLINDVLDMSRIESGKMNIEEKPENLSEILHTLKNIIQADIHSKQLEFFIDIADITNENIYCDKLRLNQILLNLVSNAIKFTPPGGTVSVRVIQTAVSKSGTAGTYEFRVKDNGIGMSKDFIASIFEPFTRERNSTMSGIEGTGLGMSITKNIVDMMGGNIKVESQEKKGTEFIVTLTFRFHDGVKPIGIIKKLEGLRGLVVDDDVNSCQSVSQMLRQIGMRAEWTRYGKEAVVRTEEALKIGDKFELYIIDLLMPDMNGIETARRIRAAVGEDTPIIILSAYDWSEIEEEAKEAGVTEFVSKPIFPSDLHRLLLKLTGSRDVSSENDNADRKIDNEEHLKGMRLLLAEDNELNREIAAELLGDEGFKVDCAENGKEAVDMLKASEPGYYGAVLMDIQMPVMNGYEASRKIRSLDNAALAEIPIIAMTANAFTEDKQAAFEAGVNAHVSKPIDVDVLMETIKNTVK